MDNIKRFKDFVNENGDFTKSVTNMNKFGIDNTYGNWIVAEGFLNGDIKMYKFFTEKEALNKILSIFKNLIDLEYDKPVNNLEDLKTFALPNGNGFQYDEYEHIVLYLNVHDHDSISFDDSNSSAGNGYGKFDPQLKTIHYSIFSCDNSHITTIEFYYDKDDMQKEVDERIANHWNPDEIGEI